MNAIIVSDASAEEIAALVVAIQERRSADKVTLAYLAARTDALEKVEKRMKEPIRQTPAFSEDDAQPEAHLR